MKEIKFEFVVKNNGIVEMSAIYTIEQLIDCKGIYISELEIIENMEVCSCSFNESVNHCECGGDYEQAEIIGKRQFIGITALTPTMEFPNGQEVYDGDIISHNHKHYAIRWSENHGYIALATNEEYKTFDGVLKTNHRWRSFNWLYGTQKYFRVVGNIYQNVELIK